jgi:hypothetical protein
MFVDSERLRSPGGQDTDRQHLVAAGADYVETTALARRPC